MIRVSQWAEIRQMHIVQQVAKKEVARRLGVNIKTVRRDCRIDVLDHTSARTKQPWRL